MPFLNQPSQDPRGDKIRAYEGVSRFNDDSTAESLHEALKQAAFEAAKELKLRPGADTEIFEVTRIQIEIGNPNVKIYRVEITASDTTP